MARPDTEIAERLRGYIKSVELPDGRYAHTVDLEFLISDIVGICKMSGQHDDGDLCCMVITAWNTVQIVPAGEANAPQQ